MQNFPVLLVVPEKCLCGVHLPEFDSSTVKTIILTDGDYSDSIDLARRLSIIRGFTYEGGAKNVARRDGLGTVTLDAAVEMGKIPDHYFQAVGSGTGAISAYESYLRLLEDGRFGNKLPLFHLSQNLPLAPMYSAWKDRRREIIIEKDIPKAVNVLDLVYARVLSNRYPPYGITGGVYDVLLSTTGEMMGVDNNDARRTKSSFKVLEGIDILPAAAVNVAALVKVIEDGKMSRDETILLNITGGGGDRLRKDKKILRIKADIRLSKNTTDSEIKELNI
jgi:cysteate synthase